MMKAAYLGLWLSLMGGVALAQSAAGGANAMPTDPQVPTPAPAAPDGRAATVPNPQGNAMPHPGGAGDPYEGEIIQTPDGTYMVTQPPGDWGQDMGPDAMQGHGGPEAMGPHPHPGHPMPPSKAAHFRIKGPDLALDVKCPEDESVKVCVDAASQLIDKASVPHH